MSTRRRIAQALARAARASAMPAAASGAITAAAGGDAEEIGRNAALGGALGIGAARLIRRTGNAGAISSVRRRAEPALTPAQRERLQQRARLTERMTELEELASKRGLSRAGRERVRQLRSENKQMRDEAAPRRTGNAAPQSSVKRRDTEFDVSTKSGGSPVSARRASKAGTVTTGGGATLKYKPGDMIVTYGPGDQAVVRADIFRDTYRKVGPGQYVKRGGVKMRASVAKSARDVETLEGPARARRGDVIMRGTRGERWPIRRDKFHGKYDVHF